MNKDKKRHPKAKKRSVSRNSVDLQEQINQLTLRLERAERGKSRTRHIHVDL